MITWGNDALTLRIGHAPGTAPYLALIDAERPLPLVEVQLAGEGRWGTAGKRHVDGAAAQRLRYARHSCDERRLRVEMIDAVTGLEVVAVYEMRPGIPVVRTWAEVTAGDAPVVLEHVSSFAASGFWGRPAPGWADEMALWTAANPWSGEFRWARATLAEHGLVDVGMVAFGQVGSKNRIARTSVGAWSSGDHLPMGCLEHGGRAVAWQIEHNGAWHWELGDRYNDVYLVVCGPTEQEHGWRRTLRHRETFTSVPAALAFVDGGLEDAAAALTEHRRRSRRPHPDHDALPVVFNDFLNCLMADPSTERLLPLVDAAAAAGAEVFCIDAGWYDDADGWWDAVGEWRASTRRFPHGLEEVIDRIRDAGMVPGLWLEPEVVGVRSPVARRLPDEAFFARAGARVTEWGRHQLDLRHPAAVAHLDEVVERLVSTFGIGYLKLDYNIDIGSGTETGAETASAGLLGHNRAQLAWLESLLDRHPGLVIENCAAGGMRLDYALLSRLPIQSLSDQQDHRLIPPIAVAAPLAVTPEQAAVWVAPQPDWSDETIAFAMVGALLGRVHLSGRIDLLSASQMAVVQAALDVYKDVRHALPTARPRWPVGPGGWNDGWLALAMDCGSRSFVAVWRRDTSEAGARIPLPWLIGREVDVRCRFPTGEAPAWDGAALRVRLPGRYSARLYEIIAS